MKSDVFPGTIRTWIDHQLDQGQPGRLSVNRHVMQTYAWPLRVYYLGTNMRWLGEADDVIAGFFESRLDRAEFFADWRRSGMRLRRWLINAFCYYMLEQRKRVMRDRAVSDARLADEPVSFSGDPHAQVDRAAAIAFVQQAMRETEAHCNQEDLQAHWRLFLRHHLDGVDFRSLADEFDVDAARAAVMSRTAQRNFRNSLREIIARDGVAPGEVDHEIEILLERIGQ